MSSSFIHVNFDLLDNFEGLSLLFKKGVLDVIEEKFEGTDVEIITNLDEARNLMAHGLDVKTVAIHNHVNHKIVGSIGEAYPNSDVSYVNMDKISGSNLDKLIQKAGLISSHELGHLFIGDHSIDGANLMSDGSVIDVLMNSDQRMDLNFTEFQKELIYSGIPEGCKLSELEGLYLTDYNSDSAFDLFEQILNDFGL